MTITLFESKLHSLPLLHRGKVRDNYAVGDDRLLMIATDRISAFDVVMSEPIPGKGEILTTLALYWFKHLEHIIPNHLTGDDPVSVVASDEVGQVRGRAMLVKRLKPLPVEAVVRGYLAGSGWKEYQATGRVCGVTLPPGLTHGSRLPEPIFTPATKAEAGAHDENIDFRTMTGLIGIERANEVREKSIRLFNAASDMALRKGLILADTKFEFGLDANERMTVMDEMLTPDSSRFWLADPAAAPGHAVSLDKQLLRGWLETHQSNGVFWDKRPPAPKLPADLIGQIASAYRRALATLI